MPDLVGKYLCTWDPDVFFFTIITLLILQIFLFFPNIGSYVETVYNNLLWKKWESFLLIYCDHMYIPEDSKDTYPQLFDEILI